MSLAGPPRYQVAVSAALAALVVAAAAVFGLYVWQPPSALPDEAEANAIFRGLHRNIYSAFGHDEESAIYDALAASVDGRLLDRVYAEVYEALVMRDQGGALSRVHSVDVLQTEVVGGVPEVTGEPRFRVRALWEVVSSLVHEGHEHVRVVEHEGVYTLALTGHGWRIVDGRILSQRPVPYLAMPDSLG